jgi:hypothetical protein
MEFINGFIRKRRTTVRIHKFTINGKCEVVKPDPESSSESSSNLPIDRGFS